MRNELDRSWTPRTTKCLKTCRTGTCVHACKTTCARAHMFVCLRNMCACELTCMYTCETCTNARLRAGRPGLPTGVRTCTHACMRACMLAARSTTCALHERTQGVRLRVMNEDTHARLASCKVTETSASGTLLPVLQHANTTTSCVAAVCYIRRGPCNVRQAHTS